MGLWHALFGPQIPQSISVAFLGGGGKTSLMHALGDEIAAYGRVILTSLTKAGPEATPVLFTSELPSRLPFEIGRPLYLMSRREGEKYIGLAAEQLVELKKQTDILLFECDGARKKPLKIHTPWDPPVPPDTTYAVLVVGAEVVNQPLGPELIHRWERFREFWGVEEGASLDADSLAEILTDPRGYRSKVPQGVEILYFVNKAEHYPVAAQELAQALRQKGARAFWGSAREHWCARPAALRPRIQLIIPAGGLSRRHPPNKLLLEVDTHLPAIARTVSRFLASDWGINVVLGHESRKVAAPLQRFGNRVQLLENHDYAEGLAAAVRLGVARAPEVEYFAFHPGDKPFLHESTWQRLEEILWSVRPPILVPRYQNQPGHPVFIASTYREKLLALKGDIGGRQLWHHAPAVHFVDMDDPGVVLDLDEYLDNPL